MSSFIGMSTERGVAAADTIEAHARSIGAEVEAIIGEAQGAQWVGEDREEFLVALSAAAEAVHQFSANLLAQGGALREQAMAQTQASAPRG